MLTSTFGTLILRKSKKKKRVYIILAGDMWYGFSFYKFDRFYTKPESILPLMKLEVKEDACTIKKIRHFYRYQTFSPYS